MPLVESFSGIRGIYDDGLDEQVAVRYCYAYLTFLRKKYNNNLKIVIGTDTRPSKDIMKGALIGVMDCDIIDLGISSTPMVEFAVRHFNADGGIIITASHNEPYWNGFKFLDNNGSVLNQDDMAKVINNFSKIIKLKNEAFFNKYLYKYKDRKNSSVKKVIKKYEEVNRKYPDFVLGFLSMKDKDQIRSSRLKVIIDPNGGTGAIAKRILESLGVRVKGINMEPGIFNRQVEPNEDSLFYLGNMVRNGNYQFAAGFDCDADRVEIMTNNGIVSGNILLALIADDILKKSKNKVIVVNNATSSMVKEIAERHKAKYVETEVGEAVVVNKMYSLKAPVGGEGSSSGVIISPSRCRDGILTLVYLLKLLVPNGKKLEKLIEGLPQYHNLKRKISVDPKRYPLIQTQLRKSYEKKGYRVLTGKNSESLKIALPNKSYVWFRVSRTESNLLRIIADAPEKDQAEDIIEEALNLIKPYYHKNGRRNTM